MGRWVGGLEDGWLGGWLYKHEKISNSVEVEAGAELGNKFFLMIFVTQTPGVTPFLITQKLSGNQMTRSRSIYGNPKLGVPFLNYQT